MHLFWQMLHTYFGCTSYWCGQLKLLSYTQEACLMMKVYNSFFWLYIVLVCLCTAQAGDCCTERDVRLVGGGNEFEGRVEVCFGGEWGTVCGDPSSWSSNHALVVCKQLFSSDLALGAVDGLFGGGSGTIFSVTCPEGETRLSECTISNQTTGCTHSQDGGAFCADPGCTEGDVRLFNKQRNGGVVMGQVELCSVPRVGPPHGGFRTKVCDTNWDDRDAEVVCRELGLSSANATAAGRLVFGEGGVITYYDNVACVGTESKLNVCQSIYNTSSRLDCGYAGVFCQTVMSTTTTVGGTIQASVSSSTVTDPTTVTPTSSPSSPLLVGILGAVGALFMVLVVVIVAIIIIIVLRRKQKSRKREIVQRPENGGVAPIETVDNAVYEASRGTREDNRRNENLVPNPLYISMGTTLPQPPGTGVLHTRNSPQELTYRP